MKHLSAKKQGYELVLPDIAALQTSELKRLVDMGKLRSLHLGRTPQIKLTSIVKLIAASSVKQLTHALLYSRGFDLTIGTQFARPEKDWSKGFPCGDGTNFPLRQVVYIATAVQDPGFQRLRGGGIKWSQAGSRSSTAVALPMEDSLMASDQLMRFVPMALRRLATNRADYMDSTFGLSSIVAGIAKQAALQENSFVSCVPGMMLATWIKAGSSSSEKFPQVQFLAPGEWTLVLCHERQTRAANDGYVVRYAFTSMDKEKKSVVMGAPEFFARFSKDDNEAAGRLSAEWQHEMAGTTLCHAEEVLEALTLALSERR